ncbi:MAG: transposase [Bacteroidota bacterium]|nr:transposase [Bacteroidota bacterium]
MEVNLKRIRKHRKYSEEFKKSIVARFEKGEFSVLQLEKLYGISNITIYSWIYKYSNFNEKDCRIVEMKDSNESKLKELTNKVKQLEQMVGQKQIAIEYLEKMIELAKTELNIDLKKNYSLRQSNGSNRINKK